MSRRATQPASSIHHAKAFGDCQTAQKYLLIAWSYTESEYFKFYQGLITNERLLKVLREKGYTLAFMPHVQFLKLSGLYEHPEDVIVYAYDKSYREIYAESNLIVTDYSSAVFDFAYLHKPIVYCQFDKEEFYSRHTVKKGYFDFERDGFGPVTKTMDECVEAIIRIVENNCKMDEVYRERVDGFFTHIDQNNCKRLYDRLIEGDNA